MRKHNLSSFEDALSLLISMCFGLFGLFMFGFICKVLFLIFSFGWGLI